MNVRASKQHRIKPFVNGDSLQNLMFWYGILGWRWWLSLIPCFKTALCYGVVPGCLVHGASLSFRIRPELAPKRGLEGPGLAFRTPERCFL